MSGITIEYTITMKNDNETLYFETYDEALDKFNEIRDLDEWEQFYSKEWIYINGENIEGDVEIFENNF